MRIMLEKQKDNLVKGIYSLFNNHFSKNAISSPIKKKGSEIKDSLSDLSIRINTEKKEYLDKISDKLGKLPYQPDKDPDYSEYHHLIDYVPKKFGYGEMYEGKEVIDASDGIERMAVKKPTEEERGEMQKYNHCVCKYMELCVSKLKVDSLRKNIQDNKSYDLTVDQLAILGL